MFRVSICYYNPADPAVFDDYYMRVHTPLVRALPGLAGFTASRCQALTPTTPVPFHLVAQLEFSSESDLQRALTSTEMRRASKDMANFAIAGAVTFWSHDLDLPTNTAGPDQSRGA
ncbi:hypothetical protein BJF84_15670 [Rhodococcus sp. CUA-806]|jgi:uncharacterized protein (TIGR02118 family)|nr:hypothetical protein BJF84_15670 [Rhodococcus sp. CUA-806]